MARGYPTANREPEAPPETGLDPKLCVVCKKQPATDRSDLCSGCHAVLDDSSSKR